MPASPFLVLLIQQTGDFRGQLQERGENGFSRGLLAQFAPVGSVSVRAVAGALPIGETDAVATMLMHVEFPKSQAEPASLRQ